MDGLPMAGAIPAGEAAMAKLRDQLGRIALALATMLPPCTGAWVEQPQPPASAAPPEDGTWAMPARNNASTRFKGLNEISRGNVRSLQVAFFSPCVLREQDSRRSGQVTRCRAASGIPARSTRSLCAARPGPRTSSLPGW